MHSVSTLHLLLHEVVFQSGLSRETKPIEYVCTYIKRLILRNGLTGLWELATLKLIGQDSRLQTQATADIAVLSPKSAEQASRLGT